MSGDFPDPGRSHGARRVLPLAVIALAFAAAYAFGLDDHLTLDALAAKRAALLAFVAANPVGAALIYVAVYAGAVAVAFPVASVMTIFGGFLFGWLLGGALTAMAATAGATLIFLAARSAFGDLLRRRAGTRAARLRDGFRRDAFSYLLILRLAPVLPFFVVNIAPALFDVRLRTFVAATFLGILPGTFAYAYLGQGIDSVLRAASASGRRVTLADIVTPEISLAFLALALVAILAFVVRKFVGGPARPIDG
jgi:uncharacterized membrane protein YdjX (TVP38/TMEM64 family)